MGTRIERATATTAGGRDSIPLTVLLNVAWFVVVILACTSAAFNLFNAVEAWDENIGLGRFVQHFSAVVVFLPAVLAAVTIGLLLTRNPMGRYLALVINFFGAVLAAAYMLQLWGFFAEGFDVLARALYDNAQYLLGVALAYAVFWLAGRFGEKSEWRGRLELLAVAVGMLALILFLWDANFLAAINHVLSQYDRLSVWLATLATVFFAALFINMLSLGAYFGERPEQMEAWQGWLMLAPNIVGFLLFFAGPLLLSFYLSFTNDEVGNVPEFTGLQNYANILALEFRTMSAEQRPQDVLSSGYSEMTTLQLGGSRVVIGARDRLFWISMGNTFLFCLLLVPLAVIPALALSIILNSKIPGMKIFRAVYFLPSVAAVVGTALIWRWLYDPVIGFFNYIILQTVNFLNSTFGANIVYERIEWLTSGSTMLLAIVVLAAWQVVGYNTVLFLAGLQGIPRELYEAAYVDGAGRWAQFRNVTLPMLGPTTFFVIITTVITGLQVFNEPYALIFQRPMPVEARTAVFHLYDLGFSRFQFGYASAVAWILFAVIFAVTLLQFRVNRSRAYQD